MTDASAPGLSLLLIDLERRPDGLAAFRGGAVQGVPATMPVAAITRLGLSGAVLAGIDEPLAPDLSDAAIVARLAPWRVADGMAGARRLAALFGAAQIAGMIAAFRQQLADAVALLDSHGEAPAAHRIAGIAGTLGFAEVSAAWLALSEGEADATAARRTARIAIAAIDREPPSP